MSVLLIDRKLLERLQERLDPHRDAVDWGLVCDAFRTLPQPAAVEVVDVVAYGSSRMLAPVRPHERIGSSGDPLPEYDTPLMTVAQHNRIVADVRANRDAVLKVMRAKEMLPKCEDATPSGSRVVPVELLGRAALLLQDSINPPDGCSDFDDWTKQGDAIAAELRAILEVKDERG